MSASEEQRAEWLGSQFWDRLDRLEELHHRISTEHKIVRRNLQRVTPQVKAHLSVILALMAIVKTAQYFLARYELNFSTRGVVEGASKTDVAAQLPAVLPPVVVSLDEALAAVEAARLRGQTPPQS